MLTYISSLTWLANNLNQLTTPLHFKYHSIAVQLVNRAIHKLDRLLTSQSINSRPQVELKRTGNCCYYYYYCFVRGVVSSSQSHHRMIMAWHKICLGSINWALLNKNAAAIDNAIYTLKGTHSGLIRIVGISPSGFATNYVCVCVRPCLSVCLCILLFVIIIILRLAGCFLCVCMYCWLFAKCNCMCKYCSSIGKQKLKLYVGLGDQLNGGCIGLELHFYTSHLCIKLCWSTLKVREKTIETNIGYATKWAIVEAWLLNTLRVYLTQIKTIL